MFGHKSEPSKIFQYGCKPPIINLDVVAEQYRLAHRYRNRLCEIELARREAIERTMREIPSAAAWQVAQAAVEDISIEIQSEAEAIKRLHATNTPKKKTKVRRDKLAETRRTRKKLAIHAKALKDVAFADPDIKTALAVHDKTAADAIKEARAQCDLHWGTYLKTEQNCSSFRRGKPPRFHRWTGDGTLAVQIQGGATLADIMLGKIRNIKITADPARSTKRRMRVIVRFLVGGSRTEPVYASIPMTYHRPIPEDALVKWVYLARRMVASHPKYHLCFVVSRTAGWHRSDNATSGIVAINLGWRNLDGLRCATWVGSDGETGTLVIPEARLKRWITVENLQGIRDTHFNAAVEALARWITGRAVPDWLTDRTQHLRKWKAPGRLAAVVLYWRSHRFDGDDAIFKRLNGWHDGVNYHEWLAKNKHLWEWQVNQRKKNLMWRADFYRNFAAKLARRYGTLVIANINYAALSRIPVIEADDRRTVAGHQRVIASPGILTRLLRERFSDVEIVDAKHITDTCHVCGRLTAFDQAGSVRHTCAHCTAEWDQDENAARNMLARAKDLR